MIRTYSDLCSMDTYEERLEYLRLNNKVGLESFGHDRYLNQKFYRSEEWKSFRNKIILRDNGCDLGLDDCPISGLIFIHHMNPISKKDIINRNSDILNPEYVICCSKKTHDQIHYGFLEVNNPYIIKERNIGDTKLW